MSEYIEKQAAIDAVHGEFDECLVWDASGLETANVVENVLDTIPPADVSPVVRGRWISKDKIFGGIPFACSNCGEETRETVMGKPRFRFCPNCGCYNGGGQNEI